MRPPHLAVVLTALVLLAGCGGVFDGDANAPASSTPANVPTDDPMADPPAGLDADGITDSFALVDTHDRAVANTSYTVRGRQTVTATNGTRLGNLTTVSRVSADHERARTRLSLDGTPPSYAANVLTIESWATGEQFYEERTGENGTTYFGGQQWLGGTVSPAATLRPYYTNAESASTVSEDGRIRLRIDATPGDLYVAGWPVDVTEARVNVTMTDEGRLVDYRIEHDGTLADTDTAVRGVYTARFTDIGETSVEPPEWLDEARNGTARPEGRNPPVQVE
ncbi:hypothetical protein ACFPYI_18260 [Halomarina salina]|uniref:Lipoprotein n=1 Tax=Halomarina salina TaxID=1872699 RepID=A0ABD5RRW4_9EURY|nr:hypothetical protein [Halomarina salina]